MPEFISIREFARREGVSDTLVRRAIKQGRLSVNAEGKLDAALVGSPWCDRNAKREQPANTSANTDAQPAAATSQVAVTAGDETEETAEDIAARIAAAGHVPAMAVSLARKEHFLALKHELQYREAAGDLIPLRRAEQVMFGCGRAARDHWNNFVGRYAALIAAEIGCEADRLTEVLTGYVHKHAAALGEPDPADFTRSDEG